jgi:hypothetical protein
MPHICKDWISTLSYLLFDSFIGHHYFPILNFAALNIITEKIKLVYKMLRIFLRKCADALLKVDSFIALNVGFIRPTLAFYGFENYWVGIKDSNKGRKFE